MHNLPRVKDRPSERARQTIQDELETSFGAVASANKMDRIFAFVSSALRVRQSSLIARSDDHEDLLDRGRVLRGGGRRSQTGRGRRRVRQVSQGPGRCHET